LRYLRLIHSGYIGDYVNWFMIGSAAMIFILMVFACDSHRYVNNEIHPLKPENYLFLLARYHLAEVN